MNFRKVSSFRTMQAPGEQLAIAIWTTVADKGIGGLLAPGHRWVMGKVDIALDRDRHLKLAQAERDGKAILSGAKRLKGRNRLVDVPQESKSSAAETPLDEMLRRNVLAEQMRREVNVAKAILRAEAAALAGEVGRAENETDTTADREVDDDWLYRWRDSASTVSDEMLQELWGRVLAGEVKAPGAFSLRTLEFLKNLSADEAGLIEKMAPYVIDDSYMYGGRGPDTLLERHGLTFSALLELDELGIIVRDVNFHYQVRSSQGTSLQAYNRLLLVTTITGGDEPLDLPVHKLTPVGRQLLKLGSFSPNEAYFRAVGLDIKGKGFRVSVARYRSSYKLMKGTMINYFDEEEL